jgi:hypothetical protein
MFGSTCKILNLGQPARHRFLKIIKRRGTYDKKARMFIASLPLSAFLVFVAVVFIIIA